jgi:carboxypeptidase D
MLPFMEYWKNLFNTEPEQLEKLRQRHKECGYDEYLAKYLAYPPPQGSFPKPNMTNHCLNLWSMAASDIIAKNPCSSDYNVLQQCPEPYDPLGGVGSRTKKYFARSDVQEQLNIPPGEKWSECGNSALVTDKSPPTSFEVLPKVIDRSERTVIVHGNADFLLLAQSDLITIQNMTWGGAQGFQSKPSEKLFVPRSLNGAHGNLGTTHTERGLTWAEVHLAGHQVPQFQPTAAKRLLEYLLGRIDSLTEDSEAKDEL